MRNVWWTFIAIVVVLLAVIFIDLPRATPVTTLSCFYPHSTRLALIPPCCCRTMQRYDLDHVHCF